MAVSGLRGLDFFGQGESGLEIAITTEEVVGKGWIAFAPEARVTAQGATESEAKDNLIALLKIYPDLLAEARAAKSRHVTVELIPA